MSISTRRKFLKTTGLLGGGLTVLSNMLPGELFAKAISLGLPYYKDGAPFSEDLRKTVGETLTLQGIIYQHDGKSPLKDAVIEIWHCDSNGHFDFSDQFIYRGKTRTDKNGRYHIKTHFPGRFKEQGHLKMRRIFVLVNGPGHQESFSQLYFDSGKNPYIDNKHWAAGPIAERPSLPKQIRRHNHSIISYDHYLNSFSLLNPADLNESDNKQLRIYPNHMLKESILSFGKHQPGNVAVRILDKKGDVVQKHVFKFLQPGEHPAFRIDELPPGVYTCSIFSSRLGDFTRKLRLG
jgi:protocatechuate 3,4-dioxygenase beta subunit